MDKLLSNNEYELRKVDNQISSLPKYRSRLPSDYSDKDVDDHGGFYWERPVSGNTSRFKTNKSSNKYFNPSSSFSSTLNQRKQKKCLEICIFLMNKVTINLDLENGHLATADELLQLVLQQTEVGLPPESAVVFNLWFTSSLLEVQLKPHHVPYQLRQRWPDLLYKYTSAQPEVIDLDEPIISFQRNAFFSKKEEMKLQDSATLELLYEEAKSNILEGRYPCDEENCYMLAGLQAFIELGPYDADVHTLDFFRTRIHDFLPEHACQSKWSIFKLGFNAKYGPEPQILEQFRNISSRSSAAVQIKKYLEFCWSLPFYGGAFFQGQIEKPVKGIAALLTNKDVPVLVAVNSEGIYVISQIENTVLLGLKYEEVNWEYTNPKQSDNPDCFPCLFLQFQVEDQNKKLSKILQIFSKQAIMMDALITFFVEEIKKQAWKDETGGIGIYDNVVGTEDVSVNLTSNFYSEALMPLNNPCSSEDHIRHRPTSDSCLENKLNRLSLATFNEEGECVGQMGSWSFNR